MTTWLRNFWSKTHEKTSAEIAKDRLHVLLVANENRISDRLTVDRINEMKLEIAQTVGKYIGEIQSNDITVEQRKEDNMDVLELSISLADVKVGNNVDTER